MQELTARSLAGPRLPMAPVWRLLPVVLVGAFAVRVAVVLQGDFVYYPDVVFQYFEPAWRLVTGDGLVVWEQFYGARSQLIPAALAIVMVSFQAIGFDHPTTLRTACEVVLCAVSVFIPWGMYAFARTAFDERTGRVALVLGTAWYELVALSGQPLSEVLALSPLLWAFALAAGVRSASGARTLAFLVVAACALRFQYAPVALWLVVLAWPRMAPRWRRHFLLALVAGMGLVALFDLVTVGTPLYRSYLANFTFNAVLAGKIVALGWDLPWYFHPMTLVLLSGGLAFIACVAGLLRDLHDTRLRCVMWLLVPIALILVTHAISPWKEYRHVFVAVPLWVVLLATSIGIPWLRAMVPARIAVSLFGVWFAAASVFGLLGELPMQLAFHREATRAVPLQYIGPSDPRLSFATILAEDKSLEGLAEIGITLLGGIGNVHLGRPTPIYDGDSVEQLRTCGLLPRDYASHAIVPPGNPLPLGFTVTETGEFGWRLAQRTGGGVMDTSRLLKLSPVWISGQLGILARQLFEGELEAESWIYSAWTLQVAETKSFFPIGRFRAHGLGVRKAQESRVELLVDCRASDSQSVRRSAIAPHAVG